MAVASPPRQILSGDRSIVLPGITWDLYVGLNDSVGERSGVRMIYRDRRLTLLTKSRKHDWYAKRLYLLVIAMSDALGIIREDAGGATYRREDLRVGVEGDETFYFGEHADLMKGAQNIDLAAQPPTDLAIEVEISHSADDAVGVWGLLGVPEIWRFDPITDEFGFWIRRNDGTYVKSGAAAFFRCSRRKM